MNKIIKMQLRYEIDRESGIGRIENCYTYVQNEYIHLSRDYFNQRYSSECEGVVGRNGHGFIGYTIY